MKKRLIAGILFFMTIFSVFILSSETEAAVKIKKVRVKSNYGQKVHVGVGKSVKLTTMVTASPDSTENQRVTYASSNTKIAKVTSSGYVKGVAAGTCKVTVYSKINPKKKASINVKVAKAVTGIQFPENGGNLYVGDLLTLKKTVTPSKECFKSVEWSSSNEKVASVNAKGLIKAVSAGTAYIKAKAVDGSGVSAKYKLKVLTADTVNIESVEILSGQVIRVHLDKALELGRDKFALEGKRYVTGNFIHKYDIAQLRNYDNKTYDITISDNYTIEEDSYVQVKIADLPGNGEKSKVAQALFFNAGSPPALNWLCETNEKIEKVVDLSDYCVGNVSYSVTGSVIGIENRVSNNKLIFTGIFEEAVDGMDLLIEAVDEMGTQVYQVVHVYAADKEHVVVAADEDVMLLTDTKTEDVRFAMAKGGSGSYRFTAEGLPLGITMAEDGTLSGTAAGIGEYMVTVTATDMENEAYTAQITASLHVSNPRKIVGTVTADDGTPVSGATIHCVNVKDHAKFDAVSKDDGSYSIYVEEGAYDITVSYMDAYDRVYNLAVSSGGRMLDFVLPLNK